ncbi:MAG: hypothetical protein ABJA74_13175 [Lapillicoccus sp.]
MDNLSLAAQGAWKVLLASIILGAGLPVVFALGVRARAFAAAAGAADGAHSEHSERHPIGNVLAVLCLLVVLTGVALGITIVVASGFGKAVSFQHIYPTIVSK